MNKWLAHRPGGASLKMSTRWDWASGAKRALMAELLASPAHMDPMLGTLSTWVAMAEQRHSQLPPESQL